MLALVALAICVGPTSIPTALNRLLLSECNLAAAHVANLRRATPRKLSSLLTAARERASSSILPVGHSHCDYVSFDELTRLRRLRELCARRAYENP